MNKKQARILTLLLVLCLVCNSCLREKYDDYLRSLDGQPTDSIVDTGVVLAELQFPADFQFKTERKVLITINDPADQISYELYAHSNELNTSLDSLMGPLPHQFFERKPSNGRILEQISIPAYVDSLLLVRKSNSSVQSFVEPVGESSVTFTYSGTAGKRIPTSAKQSFGANSDCTNIYGQALPVDLFNTNTSVNGAVRSMGNIRFPHQGVSANLVATSVDGVELKNSFVVNSTWLATPIYTVKDYVNWISTKIDTNNDADGYVEFVMNFDQPVQNILLHVRSVDYSMFQFTGAQHTEQLLSGGYEFEYDEVQRILRDTEPNSRNRYYRDGYGTILITANSGTFDQLVWRRIDDPNTTRQNDSNWITFTEVPTCNDSDGDGAEDSIDLYPQDPDRAFATYYPTETTQATMAFEDLWPFLGDYDFNDTALDYAIKTILNANNEVVALEIDYEVTADGASFVNAFAFELSGIAPSAVASVTGQVLTNAVFNIAANGTETGQSNAVIPLFDDHSALVGVNGLVQISFSNPIPEGQLGNGPFNPFLVVNGEREIEIHLVGDSPTDLGNNQPSVTGNNGDSDGNYATEEGLPWAINVAESFPVLKEKETIDLGYLFFRPWAISGGVNRRDWYKNIPGYRNNEKLVTN
ncbi:MAG: LruC domain-containing protein [Allomuricauda sp.]|nr:MAG: LruC domain-containing protein [Allomuricauda sp.]